MECTERCWTCFVLPRQNPRKNNNGRGKKTGHVDRGLNRDYVFHRKLVQWTSKSSPPDAGRATGRMNLHFNVNSMQRLFLLYQSGWLEQIFWGHKIFPIFSRFFFGSLIFSDHGSPKPPGEPFTGAVFSGKINIPRLTSWKWPLGCSFSELKKIQNWYTHSLWF